MSEPARVETAPGRTASVEAIPLESERLRAAPVLVTGAAGFVGSWLVPVLLDAGIQVVAIARPGEATGDPRARWHAVDLTGAEAVRDVVAAALPSAVVHLAAMAVPRDAQAEPAAAERINVGAVDVMLRALADTAPKARLLYVSSGEVYGRRSRDAASAVETDPLAPEGVYARTKAAAESSVARARTELGLDVVCARPFNHTGPGRPARYAEASFARQIARAERGEQAPRVRVGNLDAVRDYSDVRDVVGAYLQLLDHGAPGETYNVCSGTGRTIRTVLETLVAMADRPIAIETDPARYEPTPGDRVALIGDPARLRGLGWVPSRSFEATLRDVLEDWRTRA